MSAVISALQTPYKGYMFRSRLEARWAVFYDALGVSWSYENDPVSVAGENYLPDFVIGGGDQPYIHEVKPEGAESKIRPMTAYLAGKMRPEHDWRGPLSALDRGGRFTERVGGNFGDPLWVEWKKSGYRLTFGATEFCTNGPFASSCDHACAHRADSLHMATTCSEDLREPHIVRACRNAIEECDLVCAHISTPDCYGTLVEIGMANGLGKPVCVTITERLASRLQRWEPGRDGVGQHDLWFACELAAWSEVVRDDEQARAVHGHFIRQHTSREYRLISTLGNDGRDAVMTFGDPMHVAQTGHVLDWGFAPVLEFCHHWPAAAEAARSYRFTG